MVDIAVIGAGPAGLWAAWQLARRGVSVEVFEAGARVGGMSASISVAGQRVDLGSHRLHPAAGDAMLADLQAIGVDLQLRERSGRLRLADRWVRFPLRTADLVRQVPPGLAARLARDAVLGPVRREDRASFRSVVATRLGRTVADEFYAPYARKLWGRSAEELAPVLADRRVSATSSGAVLRRLVRARRPAGRRFLYPRTGYGEIVERVADAAVAAGATIRTGVRVDALAPGSGSIAVTVNGRSIEVGEVWSTIPMTITAALVGIDPAPFDLHTRAMALVYLVVDRDRYTAFDAHYVPDAGVSVARLSEPKNYRDGPDPAGRTVLCAEVPCDLGDETWRADADSLGRHVAGELRRLGLPDPKAVEHHVVRLPSVYPVHDHGFSTRREALADRLAGVDRLLVFGRQGLLVPDNLHHVAAMADAAVGAFEIGSGRTDRSRWSAALERFDAHVVED